MDGVRRGHLLDEALLHRLRAQRELAADLAIPRRLTFTASSFAAASAVVEKPRKPTKALRELSKGERIVDDPHQR